MDNVEMDSRLIKKKRMNQKEMEEGSKLIAEFMRLESSKTILHPNCDEWAGKKFDERNEKCYYSPNKETIPPLSEQKYHTSWDWLMPVFVKLKSTERQIPTSDKMLFGKYMGAVIRAIIDDAANTEIAFTKIVLLLNWYNKNKMSFPPKHK